MGTRNAEKMGERLRALRVDRGLSQEMLAMRLKFGSRSMVCEFESEKRKLTLDNVKAYAEYFDVSTDWILYGTGDEAKMKYATDTEELLSAFYFIKNPRARKIAVEQVRALSRL